MPVWCLRSVCKAFNLHAQLHTSTAPAQHGAIAISPCAALATRMSQLTCCVLCIGVTITAQATQQ